MVMLLVLTLSEQGAVRGNRECEVRYHVTFVPVLLPLLGPNGPVAVMWECLLIFLAPISQSSSPPMCNVRG